MKFLLIDTETTGLIVRGPKGQNKIPRAVSIAWCVMDLDRTLSEHYHIILPEGFDIPSDARSIHGISTKYAIRVGRPINKVLTLLSEDLLVHEPQTIVAHNLSYDREVIVAEFKRAGFGVSGHPKPAR